MSFPILFPVQMNTPAVVSFRGNWLTDEQEVVESAATEAEEVGLPSCAEDVTSPWMAVRTVLQKRFIYAVSRLHLEEGLLAQSAADLADRIRRFAVHKAEPEHRPFFQLAYESTASASMTEASLQQILREARSNNEDLNITGLLLHTEGHFFQVLEGPESAVRELYATIRDDPRHTDVKAVHSTSVAERTFPEWKMALENLAVVAGEEGVSSFMQTGDLAVESTPMNGLLEAIDRFRRATVATEAREQTPDSSTHVRGGNSER